MKMKISLLVHHRIDDEVSDDDDGFHPWLPDRCQKGLRGLSTSGVDIAGIPLGQYI